MNFSSTKRNANRLIQAKGKQKGSEKKEIQKKKKNAAALGEAVYVPRDHHFSKHPQSLKCLKSEGTVGHRESEAL